jgi:hypothetical protein
MKSTRALLSADPLQVAIGAWARGFQAQHNLACGCGAAYEIRKPDARWNRTQSGVIPLSAISLACRKS